MLTDSPTNVPSVRQTRTRTKKDIAAKKPVDKKLAKPQAEAPAVDEAVHKAKGAGYGAALYVFKLKQLAKAFNENSEPNSAEMKAVSIAQFLILFCATACLLIACAPAVVKVSWHVPQGT